MLNHDNDGCNTSLHLAGSPLENDGGGSRTNASRALCITTVVPVEKHEEILNSYGKKDNVKLLMMYGFCMWANPDERTPLPLPMIQEALDAIAPEAAHAEDGAASGLESEIDRELELQSNLEEWRKESAMRQLRADFEAALGDGRLGWLTHDDPIPDVIVGLARAQAMREEVYRELITGDGGAYKALVSGDRSARLLEWALQPLEPDSNESRWIPIGAAGTVLEDRTHEATADVFDWLDELFFATWRSTVSLLDLPELAEADGEERAARFEALCEQAKAVDSVKVGEGEYASATPRGCQLALLKSQLEVLMSAMDMLRDLAGDEDADDGDGEGGDSSDGDA